ncbi:DUF6912 family protein [Ornithinimicrobium panacihumi]|uniref:DUF6912 family protein n=1 Tax=Ornithinimicrobium panacihumi TaxID=2008449 RepID=UPI003F8ADD18
MSTVRCYVPLSPAQVEVLRSQRHLDGPLTAHAVTPALQKANPGGDVDQWEFAALQEAAAGLVSAGRPVIVAAVDLVTDKVDQEPGAGPTEGDPAKGLVRLSDLDLPRVAAFHLGDDVVTGEGGATTGTDGELELSWYDTTEIAHVAELGAALDGGD